MSDFERRLSSALADGADDLSGATGLADGARRKLRRRRRGRGLAVGVAVAVAAVVVPSLALDVGSRGAATLPADRPETPTIVPADGWKTVSVGGTHLSVPVGAVMGPSGSCGSPVGEYARSVTLFCFGDGEVTVIAGPIDLDVATEPGEIVDGAGYVTVGDDYVLADGFSHADTLRILGSSGPTTDPEVLSMEWDEDTVGCGTYDLPVGVEFFSLRSPSRAAAAEEGLLDQNGRLIAHTARQGADERWTALGMTCGSVILEVEAPTQAMADLILRSSRAPRADQVAGGWQQVSSGGATFDLPAGWTSSPGCRGDRQGVTPAYAPTGTDAKCVDLPGVFVYDSATFDPAYGPGIQRCASSGWCGYEIAGGAAVFVRGVDRDVAQHVLDSVRADDGTPASDGWRPVSGLGLTFQMPALWQRLDDYCVAPGELEFGAARLPLSGRSPCDVGPRITLVPSDFTGAALTKTSGEVSLDDTILVRVQGTDRGTTRRILASVRHDGEPELDLTTWESVSPVSNVSAEVPVGVDVDVEVTVTGAARCPYAGPTPAAEIEEGRWRSRHCGALVVDVIAPTPALAMVVAATVQD